MVQVAVSAYDRVLVNRGIGHRDGDNGRVIDGGDGDDECVLDKQSLRVRCAENYLGRAGPIRDKTEIESAVRINYHVYESGIRVAFNGECERASILCVGKDTVQIAVVGDWRIILHHGRVRYRTYHRRRHGKHRCRAKPRDEQYQEKENFGG